MYKSSPYTSVLFSLYKESPAKSSSSSSSCEVVLWKNIKEKETIKPLNLYFQNPKVFAPAFAECSTNGGK